MMVFFWNKAGENVNLAKIVLNVSESPALIQVMFNCLQLTLEYKRLKRTQNDIFHIGFL